MKKVVLHRHAAKYLKRMPADQATRVKAALREAGASNDPRSHPNVKSMAGEWAGCHRLRIGQYRAIFHLVVIDGEEKEEILEVLNIGPRGDIYRK